MSLKGILPRCQAVGAPKSCPSPSEVSTQLSILCNFPLPCLVNFMNNLVFCFSPKYLGFTVLTKYFIKNYLFLSWGRPQFSLFYPNFGPLLHLQYMKIHKTAFPQSCRYGKYRSFATLFTHITVLGAEQFAFPYKFILAELQLKRFWAWAKPKTGLWWGRITAKASDEFQTNCFFNKEHTKQKHQFYCVGHTIKLMFLFCVFSIKDPISLKLVRWVK